jgi:hypothetical protein
MQAYVSPLEFHTRMVDLAQELLLAGHEWQAGALSGLALQFQRELGFDINPREVHND